MRRSALPSLKTLSLCLSTGLLSGCTGTGVFFDHTFQNWGRNPNTPAGSSETFLVIRGQPVDVTPLTPEKGNVWPADTGPDKTLADIEKQQAEEIRKAGGQPPASGGGAIGRANDADRGLPPPQTPPRPPGMPRTSQTPNGPAVDVTGQGSGQGYRNLQNGSSSGSGILVPNGNGTSTLIGPDGSVQTVPTKP